MSRAAAPAAPVPTLVQVANFYASVEWFRCIVRQIRDVRDGMSDGDDAAGLARADAATGGGAAGDAAGGAAADTGGGAGAAGGAGADSALRVLSVANGSPDFDRTVATLLLDLHAGLQYTIVQPSAAHSRLTEDAALKGVVTVVDASLDEFVGGKTSEGKHGDGDGDGDVAAAAAAAAASAPSVRYDVIHVSLWRNVLADGADALRKLASLLKDDGTLVVFTRGERGVHAIRHAFGRRLDPFALPGSGSIDREGIRAALSGMTLVQEPLCSQIDLTPVMKPELDDHVARTLTDLLGVDLKKAVEAHPPLFESLMEEFREWTLTDDDRVIVYNPLLVTIATRNPKGSALLAPRRKLAEVEALVTPGSRSQEAVEGSRIYDSITDVWWPHGEKGGFCNAGLQSWREVREAWNERPAGFVPPPSPPPVPIEEVMEELTKLQRTYELPGPMRLPDVIDIYTDIWACDLY